MLSKSTNVPNDWPLGCGSWESNLTPNDRFAILGVSQYASRADKANGENLRVAI